MRVKVGERWYSAEVDQPILVELLESDKKNLVNMHPDCTKYASFHSKDLRTEDVKRNWMRQ